MPVLWCFVCGTGATRATDKIVAEPHPARTGCTLASSSSPTSTTFAPAAALAVTTLTWWLAPLFVLVLLAVLLAALIVLAAFVLLVLLVLLAVALCSHPGDCLCCHGSLRPPCSMHAATRIPLTPLDVLSTVATLSTASCHTQGLLRALQLPGSPFHALRCFTDTVGLWFSPGCLKRHLPHCTGTGNTRAQCRQVVHTGTSFVPSTAAAIVVVTSSLVTIIVMLLIDASAP
jgi:hypothetical protein